MTAEKSTIGQTFIRLKADIAIYAHIEKSRASLPFVLRLLLLTPGFQYVFLRRLQEAVRSIPLIGRPMRRVLWWLSCLIFSSELAMAAEIAGGLYIPHPYGIVVGRCRIGRNAAIMQNVTVGNRGVTDTGAPVIGDNCTLGAGAVVIGDVTIGDEVSIGANSVVLASVASRTVVVGAPARVIKEGVRQIYDI